ncbi:MAG: CoA protein activase, partial [Synergistetes bacterium]|nr:CoA protein activase [Synergistota bacterium]
MRKVTFPRMGYSYIGFRAVFDELGHEFFEPLPLTKRTLDLGVKHAPEFACFPFKITLGNLIEALETGKVDTIITAGGIGPCRYGFYGVMYEKILKEELGYNFDFILLDPPVKPYGSFKRVWDIVLKWKSELSWRDFIKRLVRGFKLAWRKLKRVEELEALLLKKRAWVKDSSKVEAIFKSAIDKMNLSRDLDEVDRIFEEAREKMESIPPERDN